MNEKFEAFMEHVEHLEMRDLEAEIPVTFFEKIVWNMLRDDDIEADMFEVILHILDSFYYAWRLENDRENTEENEDEIELFN